MQEFVTFYRNKTSILIKNQHKSTERTVS